MNAVEYWHANSLDDIDFVLVLPHDNEQMNNMLRKAFTEKLGKRTGAIVRGREARDIINLYSLYAFTDKLIIGSFDLPHGRKLRNLLDSGIATEEELISEVILGAM